MLRQAWALIALKWTIIKRTWHAGRGIALFFLTLLALLGTLASFGGAVGCYFAGKHIVMADSPTDSLIFLDMLLFVYVFFWAFGLLVEVQRADVIDMRRLLHLPIPLHTAYLLNFVASMAGPLLLLSIPCFTGLTIGVGREAGIGVALAAIPIIALFLIFLAAWAFYLRGWLALLMENKRRRQFIMMGITLSIILLGQLPSIISALLRQQLKEEADLVSLPEFAHWLDMLNTFLPPAWLPLGLNALIHGYAVVAITAGFGLAGGAMLGLLLGYRTTVQYYTGSGRRFRVTAKSTARKRIPITLRRIPFLAADTAGLTWAFMVSYFRHPAIRMQIITPIGFAILLCFLYRSDAYGTVTHTAGWLPTALIAWPFLSFGVFLLNFFGGDGPAFRGLILLPVSRQRILLAKHLALFPITIGLVTGFIIAGAILADIGGYTTFLSLWLSIIIYLTYCALGNWTSILFPYRIGQNALRQGDRSTAFIFGILSIFLLTLIFIPAGVCFSMDYFIPTAWPGYLPPPSFCATGFWSIVILLIYRVSLIHAGDLLLIREPQILTAILRERGE